MQLVPWCAVIWVPPPRLSRGVWRPRVGDASPPYVTATDTPPLFSGVCDFSFIRTLQQQKHHHEPDEITPGR